MQMNKNKSKIITVLSLFFCFLLTAFYCVRNGAFLEDVVIELKDNDSSAKNSPVKISYLSVLRENEISFEKDSYKFKIERSYVKNIYVQLNKGCNYDQKTLTIKTGDKPANIISLMKYASGEKTEISNLDHANRTFSGIINFKPFSEILFFFLFSFIILASLIIVLPLYLIKQIESSGSLPDYKPEYHNPRIFIFLMLFILLYLLFLAFKDIIHSAGPVTDFNNINNWMRGLLRNPDGIELQIMTLAIAMYFAIVYFLSTHFNFKSKILSYFPIIITCVLIFMVLFMKILFGVIQHHHIGSIFYPCIFFVVLLISISTYYLSLKKPPAFLKSVIFLFLGIIITLIILLTSGTPSMVDYCYLIGPANKIIAGEKINSFYMLYNLLLTYLFVLMQKLKFSIIQMHLFFAIISTLWIYLYYVLAKKMFINKSYIVLFLLAYFLVRFFIGFAPIEVPATTALRMDLWVLLALIVLKFNFNSTWTAISFSLYYLADDIFGLLFLLLLSFIYILHFFINRKSAPINKLVFIPILLVFISHYLFWGSVSSDPTKDYTGTNFSFLPIHVDSLFWIVLFVMGSCLYILSKKLNNIYLTLFLFGAACIQLLYFLGRSHENNLFNISGILIFIVFLTLDRLSVKSNHKTAFAVCIFIAITTALFSDKIMEKVNLSVYKLNNKIIIGNIDLYGKNYELINNDLDLINNDIKNFDREKILVVSWVDSYINYYLGLKQVGYYAPFHANLYQDKTIIFLIDHIESGYRVIRIFMPICPNCQDIIEYNNHPLMKAANKKFVIVPVNPRFQEIKLSGR